MRNLIAVALILVLAGCTNKDMNDLQTYMSDIKARPPAPLDPIPQIRQAETFLYVAGGRRNPFEPSAEGGTVVENVGDGSGMTPNFNRRKEELEHYSLDTLDMVGTLKKEKNYWGLVQTSDGTIHRVKPGNYMGRNYGKILTIGEDKISLRELISDGSSGFIERQASIALEDSDSGE